MSKIRHLARIVGEFARNLRTFLSALSCHGRNAGRDHQKPILPPFADAAISLGIASRSPAWRLDKEQQQGEEECSFHVAPY
jgi:hypothetical protein